MAAADVQPQPLGAPNSPVRDGGSPETKEPVRPAASELERCQERFGLTLAQKSSQPAARTPSTQIISK